MTGMERVFETTSFDDAQGSQPGPTDKLRARGLERERKVEIRFHNELGKALHGGVVGLAVRSTFFFSFSLFPPTEGQISATDTQNTLPHPVGAAERLTRSHNQWGRRDSGLTTTT